jgi:transposase
LPNDITELKARLIATTAQLTARTAELAAAKNGLIVTQLTIEKLKAQLAKLRREKFGSGSERIERAIEQLELALEEAEAAKAEAEASAPQPPEPEEPSADAQSTEAKEARAPEKKKRRQLPPEFARRDIVHMPPGVCKACGGSELRTVSESVTEVLAYVPARFEVIRHVRPACSCRKCETMVQAPMPELPIPRGMIGDREGGTRSHRRAVRHRACDRRKAAGAQTQRAPANGTTEDRRAGEVARCAAAIDIGQKRSRRRHPVRPLAVGRADALPRRRPLGNIEQRRRKPNPASGDDRFILHLLFKCLKTLRSVFRN